MLSTACAFGNTVKCFPVHELQISACALFQFLALWINLKIMINTYIYILHSSLAQNQSWGQNIYKTRFCATALIKFLICYCVCFCFQLKDLSTADSEPFNTKHGVEWSMIAKLPADPPAGWVLYVWGLHVLPETA